MPSFSELVSRIAAAALARAAFVILLCAAMAAGAGKNAANVLPAAILAYALLGTVMLYGGVAAERRREASDAAPLYVLALAYFSVSYASILASVFLTRSGG